MRRLSKAFAPTSACFARCPQQQFRMRACAWQTTSRQIQELVQSCEPCACGPCGLPLMWMWQIGSPVARGSVACADAALSDARFASVARPGIARSQNRVLPFRGMAQQIRAQRLSQISSHGSWTVWAGFARRGRPPACVTDVSSVYSKGFRTWL